jgi:hypothetical protein
MKTRLSLYLSVGGAIILMIFFFPHFANADYVTRHWTAESGSWFEPSNWDPYGIPALTYDSNSCGYISDSAVLSFSDSISRTINGVGPASSIEVGNSGTGKVIWNVSSGTNWDSMSYTGNVLLSSNSILNMTGGLFAGDLNVFTLEKGAIVNQSGGRISGIENYTRIEGIYNLSGSGILVSNSGAISISAEGTLNQNGGILGGQYSGLANLGIFNLVQGEVEGPFILNEGTFNILGDEIHRLTSLHNDGVVNASGITYIENSVSGLDILNATILDVNGTPGTIIYYDPENAQNDYLRGLSYNLQGAGSLMPVPEMSTILLLGSALITVWGLRKKSDS